MQFYLKVGKILLKGFASILFRSEIKYRASHFLQAVFLILRNFKIFGFEGGHFYRAYICRESVSKARRRQLYFEAARTYLILGRYAVAFAFYRRYPILFFCLTFRRILLAAMEN